MKVKKQLLVAQIARGSERLDDIKKQVHRTLSVLSGIIENIGLRHFGHQGIKDAELSITDFWTLSDVRKARNNPGTPPKYYFRLDFEDGSNSFCVYPRTSTDVNPWDREKTLFVYESLDALIEALLADRWEHERGPLRFFLNLGADDAVETA